MFVQHPGNQAKGGEERDGETKHLAVKSTRVF